MTPMVSPGMTSRQTSVSTFSAAPPYAKQAWSEGNAGRAGNGLRGRLRAVLHAGAHLQHFLNAGCGSRAAGKVDDEVGQRHQRDEYLCKIIDQRDHIALPHLAGVDALAAEPDDEHHARSTMTIVAGLSAAEMRPANICRRMRESAVSLSGPIPLLAGKGTDDARAGKVFAREQRKAIHARLYAFIKAQRAGDDQIDDKADERRGDEENERQFPR